MIKVENLTREFKINKKYPGFKGAIKSFFSKEFTIKKAVDNISFEIDDGEIVGYIGSNGAGKSTTIKMMTGILTPTSGSITVQGIVPYENREINAKNIGVVFGQRTQLWWDLPLSETFTLLKEIYEINDEDFKERMEFLNEVLALESFMMSPVRTLSLGQRMRADLAAALIHNPKIIYLDEPTIGLDVVVKENVRKAIKEINKNYGTTVILTTHDMSDIENLCNRIIIIDEGSIIYDGDLLSIKNKFGDLRTVTIELKEDIKSINKFDTFDGNVQYELKGKELTVRFDALKVNFENVMNHILQHIHMKDMKLKEISIEEVVREIYKKEDEKSE